MIITTMKQLLNFTELLEGCDFIAVDTETSPIEDGDTPDLAGISVYSKVGNLGVGAYFPVGHVAGFGEGVFTPENCPIEVITDLMIFLSSNKRLLFHNAKFDLAVLEKAGYYMLDSTVYCTLVISGMLNENGDYKGSRNGLEILAKEYKIPHSNQERMKRVAKKVGWDFTQIPPQFVDEYAVEDARLCYTLFFLLLEELKEQGMAPLLKREMDFLKVLYAIEREGIGVDVAMCEKLGDAAQLRLKAIQDELGFDPGKTKELARRLFLPPPEGLGLPRAKLGKTMTEDFPLGQPSAAKELLLPFDHLPLVARTLEYRGHRKALSTWFRGFPQKLGPDGKLHPNYKQTGTRTGRLSCSGPNLQQIPRTTQEERDEGVSKALVKQVFLADYGCSLVEFDYSQMELRLAASYSNDPDLLEVFNNDGDMHQLTADKVGVDRQDAKVLNFAIQYGAGGESISDMFNISRIEAYEMIDAYWRAYPGLHKVKEAATSKAETRHFIRYWTGKRRHFPNGEDAHKAFNSLIQGGAGEIVKSSMLRLSNYRMCNQVHDSIWVMIPNNRLELEIKEIKSIMEWPGTRFRVSFPVDVKVMATSE